LIVVIVGSGALLAVEESAPRAYTGPERMRLAFDGQRPVAEVDERFLSFAVDTAQVVGGEFWAPKGQGRGMLDTHPVADYDFGRPRLRRLAAALGPAYLRIGGTDADRTVYYLGEGQPPAPAGGARWVLTRRRWDDVNEFARAADLRVAFTLNAGPSARDDRGDWNPDSARGLIAYSKAHGFPVDVWELGNEVNAFPLLHRHWLSVDRYAGDLARARSLIAELHAPGQLAGPSSAFWPILGELRSFSEPLLDRAGPLLDIVSWHYYPQQSHRCPVATRRARAGRMLSADALADVEKWAARIERSVRDHNPRATIWLGETGGAQCGGEPGLSDAFADALWWLDELGRVARRGHAVVVRQTLSGADYGLVDDRTLEPNPSYWASWLWHNLMGRRALAVAEGSPSLRIYAHCARAGAPLARPGAVTALLVNVDPQAPAEVELGPSAHVLRLEADGLGARTVRLEGAPLRADADGNPPDLADFVSGVTAKLALPPLSIAFVLLPEAGAPACEGDPPG
jgi:hypothetical protein